MRPSDNVPNLRLVPAEHVIFHEHPERKRTLRLVERLQQEKFLRNPPIVAQVKAHEYVLLDGANRVSALQDLGYSHIPVQIIDYGNSDVVLKGWHHLLLEGGALDLRRVYERIEHVQVRKVSQEDVAGLLELRGLFALFVDENTSCWGLFPESERRMIELRDWMQVLEQVVAAYEGKTRLERIKIADYSRLPEVFESIEHELCLYPAMTKIELLQLVDARVMIPTGITRHLIPGRALGLNLDLEFLTSMSSAAQKTQHFQSLMENLEMQGRIRFYEESAFILNE